MVNLSLQRILVPFVSSGREQTTYINLAQFVPRQLRQPLRGRARSVLAPCPLVLTRCARLRADGDLPVNARRSLMFLGKHRPMLPDGLPQKRGACWTSPRWELVVPDWPITTIVPRRPPGYQINGDGYTNGCNRRPGKTPMEKPLQFQRISAYGTVTGRTI